jgi:acyl carrier protein
MALDIKAKILERAAELAGLDASEIKGDSTLEGIGLDSSDAVILAMDIEEATGHEIDVGIFLRVETLSEAAEEIARVLAALPETGSTAPADDQPA